MIQETVHIEKIVNGGFGFARLATGQIILVRDVLPGETVAVSVDRTKKKDLFGILHRVLHQNSARREPPCKFYHQCGGCDLQHGDYASQLAIKKDIIQDLLQRQNDQLLRDSISLLNEPIAAPGEWGYRQRIRLKVGRRGELGFHRYRSHEIVIIDECLLAAPLVNNTLGLLKTSESAEKLLSLSAEVEIQLNPSTQKVVIIFSFLRKVRPADIKAANTFCQESNIIQCVLFTGTDFPICGPFGKSKGGTSTQNLAVDYPATQNIIHPFTLAWEAGGFCQVNLEQNRTLIETVIRYCDVDRTKTVLDLYCGMGNFSIPLAMRAKKVVGFEGQGSAIRSAKRNALQAHLDNASFSKSSIHQACEKILTTDTRFDCVVLDPPRQGAPNLAKAISRICLERLVYISCDPATLCRDLSDLCNHGFKIATIQPVDMFPQTHHIETVVLLLK